ncbi:MAG: DUF563 domain-containing protein, partial [Okeania sp. SIO3C4]|nr:DUF563 domain-containing protein [Okeania sp. SIO3C4]
EKQKWEESILCYEKLLELKPWQKEQIEQCLSLGELLVNQNKLHLEEHYFSLGNALQKQGKLFQALDWYDRAIQLNSSLVDRLDLVVIKKGELTGNLSKFNLKTLNKIGVLEVYPESKTALKKPITLESKANPVFFQVKKDRNASLVTVQEGTVWFNNPRSLAVINSDNQFVIKEIYDGGHDFNTASINSQKKLEIDGTVAFLSGQWGENNYFHWMFDVIAKIHVLQEGGINLNDVDKFVVNYYQKQFQKDTLNALGISSEKIVESQLNPVVKAKSLIIVLSEMACSWGCEYIKDKLLPKGEKIEDCEKIYISRKDALSRRVANEEQILEFLEKFGFRSFNLSSMSVSEQALLFASAKVIVGPHGAGFTNIVFCNPGTKFLELHTPISVRPWYHIISDRCGLEYYYLIGEDIGMGNSDFTINLDSLSQLINILQISPEKERL